MTSAAMTNVQFMSMPAAYQPATAQDFPVGFHAATGPTQGVFLRVSSTGGVSILNATTGTGVVVLSALISLDA
jgi:hypothetical protein